MEYHETKNLLHVKRVLGHKCVQNTVVYIHLEKSIFDQADDSFISMAVDDLEEVCRLIDVGFEYVCDMSGKKLFRKRK